ncbi:MAG: DNA polymerase III subunit gamma/tau [Prevotellaceae bacterium]|jgi:DNA polymerase-3 subunit gamma/tau|nr:DNA polymerase III subunit gamma/tau [Prevotellaceae bacterium]
MEQFVVSALKYRPLSFSSVVGQSNIGVTLKNAIQRGHLSHAYLFCGPRGVGKTTCARIFAKTINCLNLNENVEACGQCESCRSFAEGRSYNIHELDAASNNSVEDIRLLTDKVRVPPQVGKYSVYIIDEVHMLSAAAFNAFLKTLEEPPAYAVFILATTEKHKIIPTILSRCQIYDFNRISIENIVLHLKDIAKKEDITFEDDAVNLIARKADGAMRDALSIFDRIVSFCGNSITYSAVIEDLNILDYDNYFKLTDAFLRHDYKECFIIFDVILKKGFDIQHFVSGLSLHFRDLLVSKDSQTVSLLEVGQGIAERYKQQSAKCSLEFLHEAMNIISKCETEYKSSWNPRWLVELALLNLSCTGQEKKNDTTESKSVENTVTKPVTVKKGEQQIPEIPKAISLKDMRLDNNKQETKTETVIETPVNKDFTVDDIVSEWKAYAEGIKQKSPRLSSRLLAYTPELIDNNTITYPVLGDVEKEEYYKNMMDAHSADLIEHLRTKINSSIKIKWIIKKPETETNNEKTPYTVQDKINYIISKNANIGDLIKDLELDYR